MIKDYLPWIAIFGMFIWFTQCGNDRGEEGSNGRDTIIFITQKQKDTVSYTFNPIIPTQEVHLNIPPIQSLDSATLYRILDNYFARRFYVDSISNDTIHIAWKATVEQNKLTELKADYIIKWPFTTTTIIEDDTPRITPQMGLIMGGYNDKFVAGIVDIVITGKAMT